MMHEPKVHLGGRVCFWGLGAEFEQARVEARLDAMGLKTYAPKPRTRESALELALERWGKAYESTLKSAEVLVVSKSPRGMGFECVLVDKSGSNQNQYATISNVIWTTAITPRPLLMPGVPQLLPQAGLDKLYDSASGRVHGSAMGVSLVRMAVDHLQGVSLRPNGAIYWIPEDRFAEWCSIAKAVVECADTPERCHFYALGTIMDHNAVAAVKDALSAEVMAEVKSIHDAMAAEGDDALGERAIRNRIEATRRLLDKVRLYESHVSALMPNLTTAIDDCHHALIVAQMQLDSAGAGV